MENDTRGWQYNKKTGLPELTGLPVYRSEMDIPTRKINFVLLLIYKTAKAVSSAAQRILPPWIDGKKIIKE